MSQLGLSLRALSIFTLLFGFSSSLLAGKYDEHLKKIRKQYAYLYKEKVRTNLDGSKSFHNGKLFRREGVNVLYLKGTQVEMSFQHGKLLADEIKKGAVIHSSKIVKNNIRQSVGDRPVIVELASRYIYNNYTKKLLDYALSHTDGSMVLDVMSGMSESTGIGMETLIQASFNPETLFILAGKTIHSGGEDVIITPPSNCSSFIAWDGFTKNGEIVYGRNTDFPLHGVYDKYPTVIYFEPTGGAQKYMIVASSGVHNPGIVGMNASGVWFAAHTIPTEEVSPEAMPVFITATLVAALASDFDEAAQLFKQFKSGAGWSYDLMSVKERRFGNVDINAKNVAVRESTEGVHIQTNQYRTPEMVDHQVFFNKGVDQDALARYQRIEQLTTEHKGNIDARIGAAIMGDHFDPITQTVRGFPNTVSVHTTISSFVALPESGKIYVANGMAPVSDTSYVEFPTIDKFDPETFGSSEYEVIVNDQFKREHPLKWQALQKFIEAKNAYENSADFNLTLKLLKEAMSIDTENPAYQFEAAILALRVGNLNFAKATLQAIVDSRPANPSHTYLLSHYYLGRVHAAQGQFNAAREQLRLTLSYGDSAGEKLGTAAQNTLRDIQGRRRPLEIPNSALKIMMQQADLMSYE